MIFQEVHSKIGIVCSNSLQDIKLAVFSGKLLQNEKARFVLCGSGMDYDSMKLLRYSHSCFNTMHIVMKDIHEGGCKSRARELLHAGSSHVGVHSMHNVMNAHTRDNQGSRSSNS